MTTNNPTPIPVLTRSEVDKFWAGVDIGGLDDCWPYIGPCNGIGRPRTQVGIHHRASIRRDVWLIASRVAYFLATGEDPALLLVCHSCDYPPCCNPNHLFLGNHSANAKDAVAKGLWGNVSPPILLGIQNAAAKLTELDVAAIRSKYSTGTTSYPRLGKEFNVSYQTIFAIVKRKIWKHV